MRNVSSPRDLVSRTDNMDENVPHTLANLHKRDKKIAAFSVAATCLSHYVNVSVLVKFSKKTRSLLCCILNYSQFSIKSHVVDVY